MWLEPMFVVVLMAATLAAAGLSFWFLARVWKTLRQPVARRSNDQVLEAIQDGRVPVIATFTGLRGWPWIALATNSLNPVFHVEPGHLAFRVLRQRQRPWTQVRELDVREAFGTFNLIFAFVNSPLTFVANVGHAARGAQVLALLPHSVPLSARARTVLQAAAG